MLAGAGLVVAAAVAVVPVRASVPNNPSYHCGAPVRRLQAATRKRWDRDSYLTKLGNAAIPNRRLPNHVCRRKARVRLVTAMGLGGAGIVLAALATFVVSGRPTVPRQGEGTPPASGDEGGTPEGG